MKYYSKYKCSIFKFILIFFTASPKGQFLFLILLNIVGDGKPSGNGEAETLLGEML